MSDGSTSLDDKASAWDVEAGGKGGSGGATPPAAAAAAAPSHLAHALSRRFLASGKSMPVTFKVWGSGSGGRGCR